MHVARFERNATNGCGRRSLLIVRGWYGSLIIIVRDEDHSIGRGHPITCIERSFAPMLSMFR